MPLRAPRACPSAVTAERQSTTVPNTSCTSACISLICRSRFVPNALPKWSHSNTAWLDDREMTGPIVTRCETGNHILVGDAWVVRQNFGFVPAIGHQPNHEFDGKPSVADDRLSQQHFRIERDTWVLRGHRCFSFRQH